MKARQYNERGEYVVVEMDCQQPTAEELRDRRYMEIERLKSELQESDYKVIKCAEAMGVGAELPYDVASLHKERQALRDKINKLEQQL
nr:MAG TPA: hypothetical protein [Caudoviricetes sp.]